MTTIRNISTAIKEIRKPRLKPPAGLGKQGRGATISPAKIHRIPRRKLGPRALRRFADPIQGGPNWCIPWPNFVAPDTGSKATTSLSEQLLYAAIAMYFKDPERFWEPPYEGGTYWGFQEAIEGGRALLGGQVCDFTIKVPGAMKKCVRLQSSYWHVLASQTKAVADLFNKIETFGVEVIDIYEEQIIADCTGQAAVAVVARTLGFGESPNPRQYGVAKQVRRPVQ